MTPAAPDPGDRPAVYLDAASSEPLHPAARETLLAALDQGYADPRRLHGAARSARLLLDNARAVVAESCLGVRPDEVTFTSSGTDAVHRGLLGLVRGRAAARHARRRTRRSSTRRCSTPRLWAGARTTSRRRWTRPGRVDPDDLASAAAAPEARVVALQSANHEVGTVQPVGEVARPRRRTPLRRRLRLRGPAARSRTAGRRPPGPPTSGAARPGSGSSLVRKGARWRNPFPGDDRVDERTAGFENVPAALAAAAALQAVVAERDGAQRPPGRADRPAPRPASPPSPTSRSSATRSTGSPTW